MDGIGLETDGEYGVQMYQPLINVGTPKLAANVNTNDSRQYSNTLGTNGIIGFNASLKVDENT